MNLSLIPKPHIHVWATSGTSEIANALYEDSIEASLAFLGVALDLNKYNDGLDEEALKIETVVNSLKEGRGMWIGTHHYQLVLSRCSGHCNSPTWN